jgi:uncharacterized membrane protein
MNENIDSSISNNVATKIISHAEKQNELIFATRERLFKLERTQNRDAKILCGMSIGICVILLLMCLEFGGFTW